MPRLKCDVNSCIFFQNNNCTRSSIVVKGPTALDEAETRCHSYHRKMPNDKNDFLYQIEIGSIGEINYHMPVYCEAINCKYNLYQVCYAKDIKIGGSRALSTKDTFCSSFIIK
ncbi:MAG: DUF1540 domain-containing protein [Bacilli bacterium]|nr:DUF1540 domain-containing protein [Bacilli bacterium]MDD4076782.1 DUF1540 domain-containing protein [Bacilli bacterium]MDD4389009.1 DUF1540 domain-containing protein [Bacilli bacterium]